MVWGCAGVCLFVVAAQCSVLGLLLSRLHADAQTPPTHTLSSRRARKAKEAIGAIARLERRGGAAAGANQSGHQSAGATPQSMTVNVEYNQLDPLLRATVSPDGDVDDPQTGESEMMRRKGRGVVDWWWLWWLWCVGVVCWCGMVWWCRCWLCSCVCGCSFVWSCLQCGVRCDCTAHVHLTKTPYTRANTTTQKKKQQQRLLAVPRQHQPARPQARLVCGAARAHG